EHRRPHDQARGDPLQPSADLDDPQVPVDPQVERERGHDRLDWQRAQRTTGTDLEVGELRTATVHPLPMSMARRVWAETDRNGLAQPVKIAWKRVPLCAAEVTDPAARAVAVETPRG